MLALYAHHFYMSYDLWYRGQTFSALLKRLMCDQTIRSADICTTRTLTAPQTVHDDFIQIYTGANTKIQKTYTGMCDAKMQCELWAGWPSHTKLKYGRNWKG